MSMLTDTERLDFICANRDTQGYYLVFGQDDHWVVWDQSNGLEAIGKGTTMRQAIDSAIAFKDVS